MLRTQRAIWLVVVLDLVISISNSTAINATGGNHSASISNVKQNTSSPTTSHNLSSAGQENLPGILNWIKGNITSLISAICAILLVVFGPGIGRRWWDQRTRRNASPINSEDKVASSEVTKTRDKPIRRILYKENLNFTGRKTLLNELRSALSSGKNAALIQSQVISGSGGIGKTQLALAYTYRHINDYDVIWWVKSEEPATLAADYAALAIELDPKMAPKDVDAQINAVKRWLETNSGWLLVFDNAQKPEDLDKYLPKSGSGHAIITSRNQVWEGFASVLDVPLFEREESINFLFKRTGKCDRDSANELADALGDLPLALEQAGAYIKEAGKSFNSYLKLFQVRSKEILKQGKPINYPKPVATTWDISVEAARKDALASTDLLNLCSFLAPDQMPRYLLTKGSDNLPEPLASAIRDEMELDKVLTSLRRYSLIDYTENGFSIHRMIQAVTRDRLSGGDQKKWVGAAVKLVDGAFPKDHLDNPLSWSECSLLLPHALAASRHAQELRVESKATGHLLNDAGLYLQTRGEFNDAKSALENALQIDETVYGPDHPNVAIRVNNLGLVLKDLGELQEARKLFERALKIDETVYGPDHPNVAIRVNNLGGVLKDLGELQEARKLYERALKIFQTRLGEDHPSTIIVSNNLESISQD